MASSPCAIMNVDGYVSRGKAAVHRDYAVLQDFAAYLELRLKSQNLSILRRIFADFLNEHESTLIPMMQQGCTIITIFPVERTSVRRRQQAESLLSKPKSHLDSRACVFLYLQYRTATRNMALLKHIFLEFIDQRETSLLAFVERGCQVISVIPFELPKIAVSPRPLSPRLKSGASPRPVEMAMGQEQTTSEVAVVEASTKKNLAVQKTRQRQTSNAGANFAEQQPAFKKGERKNLIVVKTRIGRHAAEVENEREIVSRPRKKRILAASSAGSACSRAKEDTNVPLTSNYAAVLTRKHGRKVKSKAVPPKQQPTAVEEKDEGNVPPEASTTESLPAPLPNDTSSTEAPGNIARRRSKRASVASTNESAVTNDNEAVKAFWISSPTAIPFLQCRKKLMPGAVPSQQDPTAVVEQDDGNAPIEALTSESSPTESSANRASSTETLGNIARCQAGVVSTNEAASNEAGQDNNAPALTAGSILNCGEQSKDSAVLSRQDVAAAIVDQTEVMQNIVLPASADDLAIETLTTEAVTSELEIGMKRRLECVGTRSDEANQEINAPLVSETAKLTPKQDRQPTAKELPPQQSPAALACEQGESLPLEAPSLESPQTEASMKIIVSKILPIEASLTEAPQTAAPAEVSSASQHKRGRESDNVNGEKKSRKRGKPFMSEEMCRSQLELTRKMDLFEAQSPWRVAYGNLPVPFDAERYPELARKFSRFWHRHLRAVWERKFWAPMSRKLCLPAFNKRNNRQLMAKNAFELLIVSVYEELGASFFVKIDMQKERHQGWWYRGPVVALFTLQQIKGEDAMWDYVKNEAFKRFPDCNLPIPLTAASLGTIRSGYKQESESMWMVNHRLTAGILREIAVLKADIRTHEQEASHVTAVERDCELKNSIALVEALELL